ncbi:MAG: PilZ domain-containing protein [Legionellales bacterium]
MTEQKQLIHCSFKTEALLYAAFMPFVKSGGLFVRTSNILPLGTEVDLSLTLLDEMEPYLVKGLVVWITPKSAQDNKPPGIGIQFSGENSRHVSNKIETYLAGMLKSTQQTDTI